MNPGVIITARMNSTRLPGKALLPLGGHTVLGYIVKRLEDHFPCYVATPDAEILSAAQMGVVGRRAMLGSEEDVRGRVIECAENFGVDPVIRVTGDCPFVDPWLVKRCVELLRIDDSLELAGLNCGETSAIRRNHYPEGVDCEAVWVDSLDNTENDERSGDREHVTQHIKRRAMYELICPADDYRDVKTSIDTWEDYRQACLIAGKVGIHAGWKEIAECARWWKSMGAKSSTPILA